MHKVIELVWKRIISLAKDFSYSISREHERSLIKSLEELFIIINQENGYISFFLTILNHLDHSCAISLSFLKHVIEKSDLPSPSTLCLVIEHIVKAKEKSVNGMVILILFSHHFSGHLAEAMFTTSLSTFLIHSVLFHDNNSIRMYALLALDGFATTGSIKNAILSHPLDIQSGLSVVIQECETRQKKKRNSILDWWLFKRQKKCKINLLSSDWSQLELCAKWSFDYTFGKKENEEKKGDLKIEYNVILDKMTATNHCKLSRDCLALRNDQSYFESIRATACVFSGKWYFETLIFTSGIIHIGWSTFQSKFQPELGYGVGDDPYGFGFDTYRSAIWCAGKVTYPSKSKQIRCQPGDVIGSFLDADQRMCSFFINGQEIAHFKYNKRLEGLYPSFSLSTLQHIRVNFGNRPWHYERRRSNVQLKPIIRRNQTRALNNNEEEKEEEENLCILCFSEPKNVILFPCHHTEFGYACSKLIKQCPLCRCDIQHIKHPSLTSIALSSS